MRRRAGRSSRRRGLTLVEAVISTVIVGGVLVAALTSVATSRKIRARAADRARAQALAIDLMSEVLQQNYQSPAGAPAAGAAARSAWTDVGSYNGLTDSPPQTKAGTPIVDCAGWSRTVAVDWIDPQTLTTSSTINTGIRRVTVTVSRAGVPLGSAAAYRTSGWVDTIPNPATATGNHSPVASATASSVTGRAPLNTTFDGTASTDRDGDVLSYVWNFGDGSAGGSGPQVPHTYAAAGTYNATLTVYDGRGGVGVSAVTITVTP